ncbi:putative placenta-specific protein 9 [Triplophysa rosa]|uniref:Placenta-specific protein 9 n=1 Tax=Triplophysa rosa TaxID=992332 RepID=A0A9W7WPN9_TRIRA|nr:putative placenta-specific protein 9 [Triplophysa rosa]
MGCWSTHVTLLMLLIGQISAGPDTVSRLNSCQDHNVLHNRMDAVEKRLEDTVEMLETELAVLLDAIEAPEWSPLLDTDSSSPVIDILQESPHES